jgi:prefoldin subunit 5
MSDKTRVEMALTRLDAAIVGLSQSIDKRQTRDLSVKAMQDDLQRMTRERSDLTGSLEKEKARAEKLEGANEEVSRRLGSAMESVRAVLDRHGG